MSAPTRTVINVYPDHISPQRGRRCSYPSAERRGAAWRGSIGTAGRRGEPTGNGEGTGAQQLLGGVGPRTHRKRVPLLRER